MPGHAEIGARVKSVMVERGMLQKELAEALGLPADAISRSLSGGRAFSSIELAEAADALEADIHWLITGEVDPLAVTIAARHNFDHQTGERDVPGEQTDRPILDDIVLAYRQAYPQADHPTAPLPRPADEVRALLGDGFVREFADRIEENLGIDVLRIPGLSTAYSLVIGGRRIVVMPTNGSWWRSNWSLAHELGHHVLGHHDSEGDPRVNEAPASAFAAALLMPSAMVRGIDWSKADEATVAQALWDWGVSTEAARIRLSTLKVPVGEVAAATLGRLMPGVLRRHESELGEVVRSVGRLAIVRSPVDERMEAAGQRRFPQTLIARHRELVEAHKLNPGTLAWMLDVTVDDLGIEPIPPQDSNELTAAFGAL